MELALEVTNRDAKASGVVAGGITWETDIGRCWEKNEARWMSARLG